MPTLTIPPLNILGQPRTNNLIRLGLLEQWQEILHQLDKGALS